MKAFAELYANLDATTSSNAKLAALQAYFRHAAPEDDWLQSLQTSPWSLRPR